MRFRRLASLLTLGLVVAAAPAARAHVQIRVPKQRITDQKVGPCGLLNSARSQNVCEFRPGATITLEWDETIEHPGHFRVSFDEDGVDSLEDPSDYDDFDTAASVLIDQIPDRVVSGGDQRYSIQVPLPNVECDNCTLQLIQVMTDKPPWGPGGGNDIYYQCADLVLSASAPAEPAPGCGSEATGGPDGGPGGDDGGDDGATDGSEEGGGCAVGKGQVDPLIALLGLALVALRARRRASGARSTRAR
jgi:hypothetical protein